jgi:hypothetical protein
MAQVDNSKHSLVNRKVISSVNEVNHLRDAINQVVARKRYSSLKVEVQILHTIGGCVRVKNA